MKPAVLTAAILLTALLVVTSVGGASPVGEPAPSFELEHWRNVEGPLEPGDLRGHVVLVRWWTDTCPFCSTSAPVLNELHRDYAERGLRVVGIFHPKPAGDDDPGRMRRAAERFGFTFPVALDDSWVALRRWWLSRDQARFTSVSFVLDRKGVIRWVHPGGEYHLGEGGRHLPSHEDCRQAYRTLRATIERLLDE